MNKKSSQMSIFDMFSTPAATPEPNLDSSELDSTSVNISSTKTDLAPVVQSIVEPCPSEASSSQGVTELPAQPENSLVYELYVSDTCPNCGLIKAFVKENLIDGMGRVFNLSTDDEALPMAKKRQVYELPAFLIIEPTSDSIVAMSNNLEGIIDVLKEKVNYVPTIDAIASLLT